MWGTCAGLEEINEGPGVDALDDECEVVKDEKGL